MEESFGVTERLNAEQTKQFLRALELIEADDFRTGSDWEEAHSICKKHEGITPLDRVHALCHRVEGDDANAAYWYRRARVEQATGSLKEEWRQIRHLAD